MVILFSLVAIMSIIIIAIVLCCLQDEKKSKYGYICFYLWQLFLVLTFVSLQMNKTNLIDNCNIVSEFNNTPIYQSDDNYFMLKKSNWNIFNIYYKEYIDSEFVEDWIGFDNKYNSEIPTLFVAVEH